MEHPAGDPVELAPVEQTGQSEAHPRRAIVIASLIRHLGRAVTTLCETTDKPQKRRVTSGLGLPVGQRCARVRALALDLKVARCPDHPDMNRSCVTQLRGIDGKRLKRFLPTQTPGGPQPLA